jgi:hypothetical protein
VDFGIETIMAYRVVALKLSAYGFGKQLFSLDSWSLFKYLRTDYLNGHSNSLYLNHRKPERATAWYSNIQLGNTLARYHPTALP